MESETSSKHERRDNHVEALPTVSWRKWVIAQIRALRKWIKVHLNLRDRALKLAIKNLHRDLKELKKADFVIGSVHRGDIASLTRDIDHAEARVAVLELANPEKTVDGIRSWQTRADERISILEQTNAKNAGQEMNLREISKRLDSHDKFMWVLTGAYFLALFGLLVYNTWRGGSGKP